MHLYPTNFILMDLLMQSDVHTSVVWQRDETQIQSFNTKESFFLRCLCLVLSKERKGYPFCSYSVSVHFKNDLAVKRIN